MDNMTAPKRWPNIADRARMDSIASAIRARNCIKLAMQHITDAESLRNLFEAQECCHEIEITLVTCKDEIDREDNSWASRINEQTVFGEDDR